MTFDACSDQNSSDNTKSSRINRFCCPCTKDESESETWQSIFSFASQTSSNLCQRYHNKNSDFLTKQTEHKVEQMEHTWYRCCYTHALADAFKFVHEGDRAQEKQRLPGLYTGIPDDFIRE